jgi:hypothetical protein
VEGRRRVRSTTVETIAEETVVGPGRLSSTQNDFITDPVLYGRVEIHVVQA